MTGDLVLSQMLDGVAILTLNRPDRRNALTYESWTALGRAVEDLRGQAGVRGVVLTGAGGFFSAGGDLTTGPAHGDGPLAPAARVEHAQEVMGRIAALPVPVIAAVDGGAVGLGWSLALSCDLVVADPDAFFSAPFVARAVVPDGGLAWRLVHQLGRLRASAVLLRGTRLPAVEAAGAGLVTQLAGEAGALAAAMTLAHELAAGEAGAVELTKRLLRQAESADPASFAALELATAVVAQQRTAAAAGRAGF